MSSHPFHLFKVIVIFFLGSRTIRTEEAILISLAALDAKLEPAQRPKEFDLTQCIPQSEDTGIKQFEVFATKRKHKKPKQFENVKQDIEEDATINDETDEAMENTAEEPNNSTNEDLSRFD